MGMIILVFKHNGKPRTQPINYRPITLLPCIYKLFEKVLHERINNRVNENKRAFPNRQQNAYQKCKGALTASFNLPEGIYQNNELNSFVYVCMLDTKQAIDTVWLDNVFYKMIKLGVTCKIWTLLVDAHTNMSSCVASNGLQSTFFPVRQGIRQGGTISTWLYKLFIDDLINELEK
jgi:hypothetical protein